MTLQETGAPDVVSFEDLKSLATAKGPCITVITPIPNPLELRTRLKNMIHEVEKKLASHTKDTSSTAGLLEPLHALAVNTQTEGRWANGLIVFRSSDLFRHYWLHNVRREFIEVGDRFQIRPLLPLMSREQRFYLLALSQQRTRLFHGSQLSLQELRLVGAPPDLRTWMNARQPDHVLDNRAFGGPSVGSMEGVMFGTNTDRERKDEYLRHFFKEIDKSVHTVLRDDTAPLLLAGVEYEVAIYREVNTCPHVWDKAIHGSPDGLPDRELHQHAMEIVEQSFSERLKRVFADLERLYKVGRESFVPRDIVKAAYEGRVEDLLISEDAELRGTWNEQTYEPQIRADDSNAEDLLNAAALQTISQRGRAYALRADEMPGKADALAVLRF